MANPVGLLGDALSNPFINMGVGLLSAAGPSRQPVSLGQALASGVAAAGQARQHQLANALVRQRLTEDARRRSATEQLRGLLSGGEQAGPTNAAAARMDAGAAAGEALAGGRQQQVLGLLAEIAPEQVAKGLLAQISPQKPTTLEREFEFLTGIGIEPNKAIEALQRGTTVNVGDSKLDQPLPTGSLKDLVLPNGESPPPGTTLRQAREMGAVVQSSKESEKSNAAARALGMLDRLDQTVTENDIEPGFLNEGGIAELLATPGGQAVSKGMGFLGLEAPSLTDAQANALSLQEKITNEMLAAMRGASVGPEEQVKFEQQLPRLSQTPEVFRANVENTRRNLEELTKRMKKAQEEPTAKPTSARPGRLSPAQIGRMTLEDLAGVKIDVLSPSAKRALDRRLKDLGF